MTDESYAEKLRSINFGQARHRKPKVTTDVHDDGRDVTHTVDVTEHYHQDRQDVTVRLSAPATHQGDT